MFFLYMIPISFAKKVGLILAEIVFNFIPIRNLKVLNKRNQKRWLGLHK